LQRVGGLLGGFYTENLPQIETREAAVYTLQNLAFGGATPTHHTSFPAGYGYTFKGDVHAVQLGFKMPTQLHQFERITHIKFGESVLFNENYG
jgi:hypothetical protein